MLLLQDAAHQRDFLNLPHAAARKREGIPRRFCEGKNGDGIYEARDAQAAPIRVEKIGASARFFKLEAFL